LARATSVDRAIWQKRGIDSANSMILVEFETGPAGRGRRYDKIERGG